MSIERQWALDESGSYSYIYSVRLEGAFLQRFLGLSVWRRAFSDEARFGLAYGRFYALYKGTHLLIDCRNVSREVCLDDRGMLDAMARAATRAGANVISQVRYHFGHNSPPGFTAVCLLDESHVSAHCYADTGQIALDVFTCGSTDPRDVLAYIREEIDLGDIAVKEEGRFCTDTDVVALGESSSPLSTADQGLEVAG